MFSIFKSFGYTGVCIRQNSVNAHLRFVYFTACKFHIQRKTVNKYWPLADALKESGEKCVVTCELLWGVSKNKILMDREIDGYVRKQYGEMLPVEFRW